MELKRIQAENEEYKAREEYQLNVERRKGAEKYGTLVEATAKLSFAVELEELARVASVTSCSWRTFEEVLRVSLIAWENWERRHVEDVVAAEGKVEEVAREVGVEGKVEGKEAPLRWFSSDGESTSEEDEETV